MPETGEQMNNADNRPMIEESSIWVNPTYQVAMIIFAIAFFTILGGCLK